MAVKFIPGHNPDLVILDENGQHQERIDLTPYKFDELHVLFKDKGFRLKSEISEETEDNPITLEQEEARDVNIQDTINRLEENKVRHEEKIKQLLVAEAESKDEAQLNDFILKDSDDENENENENENDNNEVDANAILAADAEDDEQVQVDVAVDDNGSNAIGDETTKEENERLNQLLNDKEEEEERLVGLDEADGDRLNLILQDEAVVGEKEEEEHLIELDDDEGVEEGNPLLHQNGDDEDGDAQVQAKLQGDGPGDSHYPVDDYDFSKPKLPTFQQEENGNDEAIDDAQLQPSRARLLVIIGVICLAYMFLRQTRMCRGRRLL